MAKMTPEGKVKKRVKEILTQHGVYYIMPFTAGFGNSGVPDFICCHRGRFFGVETKADTDLTALQIMQLTQIGVAGGRAFVVRINAKVTEGLDELINFLKEDV